LPWRARRDQPGLFRQGHRCVVLVDFWTYTCATGCARIAQARNRAVEYPVAVDNDYVVWRAFSNRVWPALYIADAEGRLRYDHFGEGEYAMAEMVMQQLPLETGAQGIDQDLVAVQPRGMEMAAAWPALQSPETYLSYAQSTGSQTRSTWRTTTPPHRSCPSTTGTSPGAGRSRSTPRSPTSQAGGSYSSSTRAIST
jgi:hypothetical protein